MKRNESTEVPVSSKLLKRKVLERWENEGGRICTDPGDTSLSSTQGTRGTLTPPFCCDSLAEGKDCSCSGKRQAKDDLACGG